MDRKFPEPPKYFNCRCSMGDFKMPAEKALERVMELEGTATEQPMDRDMLAWNIISIAGKN